MVSEKLIAFILKARQNKRNDDQIAQQLLSVGWKQDAITDAFSEIKAKKITAPTPAQAAKMASAQAAQKPAAPSQPQPAAPPWVKPEATSTVSAQPAAPAAQPPAQATAPQQIAPAVSSAPQPPSSAPPEAAQSAPAPAQQVPQAQAQPVIPTPQPAPASAIPPASQIQLPSQKKSLFSSLFAKKPSQPSAPAAPQQQAAAPEQKPAAPAAKAPIFPPRAPTQATLQPPAVPQQPAAQGQSTLATFAGATAQQSATASTAPAMAQPPLPSTGTAPGAPKAPAIPSPPSAASPSPPQQAAAQAKPAAGIMKFLPIIGLVVLLAIAVGAFYVFVMAPANSAPPTPSQPLPPPVQNATPSNITQQASGPIDCGNDMGCFSQASSTCTPAKMVRNSSTDLLGMAVSGSTYMEIRNTSEPGKCLLYSLTSGASVNFSSSAVAAALAKGVSMDDIQKQEAASAAQAKATIGTNGTCKFNAADLSALLGRWNTSRFASTDYAGADCSGSMFIGPLAGGIASVNLSNLPVKNATVNGSANATIKPGNATNNSSSVQKNATSAPKANATTLANASANTTSGVPANASSQQFAYFHKYTTYYPEHLDWFCTDRNMEFYRMHYQVYFGGGCGVPKPKEGFVSFDDYVATGCTMIPCCINGPYNEYSLSYDYFECGYN